MNAVHYALLAGLAVAACILAGLRPAGRLASAARVAAAVGILAGIGLAQSSSAFDGYDTDFWFYALIVERVADGQAVWEREPIQLEPPPNPQVSPQWILVGLVRRYTGVTGMTLFRLLAVAGTAFLCLAGWTLAARVFPDPRHRWAAVLLLWLGMPDQWWSVELGRSVSLGFMLLAAACALALGERLPAGSRGGTPGRPGAQAALLALWIALAFHTHLFGGVLAVGAVAVATLARWRQGRAALWGHLSLALLMAVLLASPTLVRAFSTRGLPRIETYLAPRGGQFIWGGFIWPTFEQLRGLVPLPLLGLAALGLLLRPAPAHRMARGLAGVGTLLCALVFLTPLYHLAATVFTGWLVVRIPVLAFPWIAAALALVRWGGATLLQRALGGLLLLGLTCGASLELTGALLDRTIHLGARLQSWARHYFEFSPDAQAEAYRMRPLLRDKVFVSADSLAYGVTAGTLGRPLATPPGHSSAFGDFVLRKRWVDRALHLNTPECWAALFSVHPEIEFLLTPAPAAEVERAIWDSRFPEPPEAIRASLAAQGALTPVFAGRYFVLDRIRNPLPNLAADVPTTGPGRGRLCP